MEPRQRDPIRQPLLRARHDARYERFRTRFCHLEDGLAAARVVDAVFEGGQRGAAA